MSRGKPNALLWHEIKKRIMLGRHSLMDRVHHTFIGLRTCYRCHCGIGVADLFGLRAHASRHNHFAILGERLADGFERLRFGAIKKAACVDDDGVCTLMIFGELVTLCAQPRDDALAIDERLGTAKGNK